MWYSSQTVNWPILYYIENNPARFINWEYILLIYPFGYMKMKMHIYSVTWKKHIN
jgi:hypothetical protein